MNTVCVERQKTTITSQMTTNSLRAGTLSFGKERLVFSQKEVGTHSIRSGFAMELYLANTRIPKIGILVLHKYENSEDRKSVV